MHGRADRLLYVGKARNLRERVGSYRHVNPERHSRKTVRLVHSVENILWEICESDQRARLRENQLLREHRPPFNRVGVYPKAYSFIEIAACDEGFRIALKQEPIGNCFGAFKGNARGGFAALARLLWSSIYGKSHENLPRSLILERGPREVTFTTSSRESWLHRLEKFLSGDESVLTGSWLETETGADSFARAFRETDLANLKDFFVRGPQRNDEARRKLGWRGRLIRQEELDDLLVQAATQPEPRSSDGPNCTAA